MSTLFVTGKHCLTGSILISGRKNAALKLIAASVLSTATVTLTRVPDIADVRTMLSILSTMGASVSQLENGRVVINTSGISDPTIPFELGRKLRASLVLVGPLLARFHSVTFPHPGGCVIGKRTIAPHLRAFENLGAVITFDGSTYTITAKELVGGTIYLKEKSVTGTENLIMAAVKAHGQTTIMRAAEESHIGNLCHLLREMGYQISGDGSSTILITGLPEHNAAVAFAEIIADEIEVGTFAAATLVTGGTVTLERVGSFEDIVPILSQLDDMQALYLYDSTKQSLLIKPSSDLQAASIQTNPWPGFPPDLQSPFTVLATQAVGTTLVHDWMYEGRLYFVDLLQKMGANIVICDPHRALVTGPTPLYRSTSITPDLRAGAALVVAALAAEGTSEIEHAELIDRGYANLESRLQSLGAEIRREG